MNIPLLNAPSIPILLPLNEKGLLGVSFAPLYNPGILVCDKGEDQSNPQDLPIACKGVLIAVDTTKRYVYVGDGGIKQIKQAGKKKKTPKSNLSGNEYSRLYRVLYKDKTIYKKMPGWSKAILIFDWENDIKLDENKKEIFKNLETRIDDEINKIIKKEIADLKKTLIFKINESKKWNLKNDPRYVHSDLKNLTFANSERCRYYVAIVMELMEEIVNGNIAIP